MRARPDSPHSPAALRPDGSIELVSWRSALPPELIELMSDAVVAKRFETVVTREQCATADDAAVAAATVILDLMQAA